jgi:rRNA maturation endonuclease Nob1
MPTKTINCESCDAVFTINYEDQEEPKHCAFCGGSLEDSYMVDEEKVVEPAWDGDESDE